MKFLFVSLLLALSIISVPLTARMALDQDGTRRLESRSFSADAPAEQVTDHRVGQLVLTVSNIGSFGDGFISGTSPFNGFGAIGCEFPKNSGLKYIFAGAFWIGAVVGRDTLVSVGADGWENVTEMGPTSEALGGGLRYRSLIDPSSPYFEGAVSEEDVIAVYTDTATVSDRDWLDGRAHRPLNIKVTEASYAWSYSYAEDFVLFDYKVENMGFVTLDSVYMGIYVDADVGSQSLCDQTACHFDDICGFLHAITETTAAGCAYRDTLNIAWIADEDGDPDGAPNGGSFNASSATSVTGTRIVRTPNENLNVSFNWWISGAGEFAPRERAGVGRLKESVRNFQTGSIGTPMGDRNKYYMMRNQEFDYDQVYTGAVRPEDSLWLQPPQTFNLPQNVSDGIDTRYLLSFGPFTIEPGDVLPLSFAYVAGENFHIDPNNAFEHLYNNYDPDLFYDNIGFDDLALNARWAGWIYDNPGIDTDEDGFSGKFILCPLDSQMTIDTSGDTFWTVTAEETTFITGDGIPDFQGAKPPPAPDIWVTPSVGKFHVRFNGFRSENTPDEFLKVTGENPLDFEGYRVYISRDERTPSFTVISSYDIEDYNKLVYPDGVFNSFDGGILFETPFTREELEALYHDTALGIDFDPLNFTRNRPLSIDDSLFYFEPQDFNVSRFGIDTEIRKRFPNQPYPSSLDIGQADPSELTEDGYFKYFEYEIEIDNLLPTVAYYVSVTAFDYGSPASGLPSLESSVTVGAVFAYAQHSSATIDSGGYEVYVYPNPYRVDADYLGAGYEGRRTGDAQFSDERKRTIHFANVPSSSTIRIYSLDGDLVSEFDHDVDPSDPAASNAEWNMITRNTQLVVSGIYYWTVENKETGETQIGKLAIIM